MGKGLTSMQTNEQLKPTVFAIFGGGFVDFFISSCYVHLRKADTDIFQLALDTTQASIKQAVYIENTPMFVRIVEGLGIQSILDADYKSTSAKLFLLGLEVPE
jgi:putative hydrolase of the HAD superfamily